jgi:CheY-like chemotaxis protein
VEPVDSAAKNRPSFPGEKRVRIIYVEDTLLNLCLIERIARIGNHRAVNHAYAERALQNVERDQPDLILVDLRLEGDMNSVEFVRRLREAGHTQPIFAITALEGDEVRERCLAVGCNEFFNKPLPVRQLVTLLERYGKTVSQNGPSQESSSGSSIL